MRKFNFVFYLIFFVFSLAHGQTTDKNFIKIQDGHFILNEAPYNFLGANFWHGAYLGAELNKGDRKQLLKELDFLTSIGISNLRIMASSEESDFIASIKPVFQSSPGKYNEELLQGLDFLLNEMAQRNMKAVLVLNNYWQWSGGMSQYVNWADGTPLVDPDVTSDWYNFMTYSAGFYRNQKANTLFRQYIAMLINRKNTFSGSLYKNDPTIMAWQLANEPRSAPDAANNTGTRNEFVEWVNQTAKYIHSLDANHLVSTGSEGTRGSSESDEIFLEAHGSAYIDYLTFHVWPKNWRWFDAKDPENTFEGAKEKTLNYVTRQMDLVRKLKKPVVLEEFGLERDNGSFSPDSPTTYRDTYLEMMFQLVVDSIQSKSPLSGLNFWTWSGFAKPAHDDFKWYKNDPFMGDPPQEPQGLNSVFASDSTTLTIIRKYTMELQKMND